MLGCFQFIPSTFWKKEREGETFKRIYARWDWRGFRREKPHEGVLLQLFLETCDRSVWVWICGCKMIQIEADIRSVSAL
jgi:hypothetical protein